MRLGKETYPPEGYGTFSWKCKLKLQWDTTTCLLGKVKRLATPNIDKTVKQLDLSFIVGGNIS